MRVAPSEVESGRGVGGRCFGGLGDGDDDVR